MFLGRLKPAKLSKSPLVTSAEAMSVGCWNWTVITIWLIVNGPCHAEFDTRSNAWMIGKPASSDVAVGFSAATGSKDWVVISWYLSFTGWNTLSWTQVRNGPIRAN